MKVKASRRRRRGSLSTLKFHFRERERERDAPPIELSEEPTGRERMEKGAIHTHEREKERKK